MSPLSRPLAETILSFSCEAASFANRLPCGPLATLAHQNPLAELESRCIWKRKRNFIWPAIEGSVRAVKVRMIFDFKVDWIHWIKGFHVEITSKNMRYFNFRNVYGHVDCMVQWLLHRFSMFLKFCFSSVISRSFSPITHTHVVAVLLVAVKIEVFKRRVVVFKLHLLSAK